MSEKSTPIEIEMRGSVLKLSITIELALMSLVYFSNSQQYSMRKAETLKLKNCMFSQKIERAKKVLETFHPDLMQQYSKLFNDIEDFKPLRNRMAHCATTFGGSLTDFEIWDITQDEDNFQFYALIKFTVRKVYEILLDMSVNIIPVLKGLQQEVELRLKKSAPHVYDVLKQEDNSHQSS